MLSNSQYNVRVEDILSFRLIGGAPRSKRLFVTLLIAVFFFPVALITIMLSGRCGVERYHKDTFQRILYIRKTAICYLLAMIMLSCVSFVSSMLLAVCIKGWVLMRCYKLVFVYHRMPYSQSDVAFAKDALKYMERRGEYDSFFKNK